MASAAPFDATVPKVCAFSAAGAVFLSTAIVIGIAITVRSLSRAY